MLHQLLPAPFDTLWPPRFAAGCCGYQYSSRTFQQLSRLRSCLFQTPGPLRSMGTQNEKAVSFHLPLWHLTVCTFVLLLNRLVWFDFSLLLRKHMALESQLAPYDRAVIASPHILPAHTLPTYAHFSFLPLLWWRWSTNACACDFPGKPMETGWTKIGSFSDWQQILRSTFTL